MNAYHCLDVPVLGGDLHVAHWCTGNRRGDAPVVLAIHGVTANHLAWSAVARHSPYDVVAPDLRGRGRSGSLPGPAGMRRHAEDLVAVLDHLELERVVVVGHSMGGFVATALMDLAPSRVARVLLVDGGLPLPAPPSDLTSEQALTAIIGPAAQRLQMTFADTAAYLDFWRDHPALGPAWCPEVEAYLAYDLTGEPPECHSSVSLDAVRDDSADLLAGEAVVQRAGSLPAGTTFLRATHGMLGEPGGLYPADLVAQHQQAHAQLRFVDVDGVNHYTVVMSDRGAQAVVGELSR